MSSENKTHTVVGYELRRATAAHRQAMLAMYETFEPKGAALGLPPRSSAGPWLESIGSFPNFIVTQRGRIVGHAVVCPEGDSAEVAVFVHQDHRGRGLGTVLLGALVEEARRLGLRRIWGTTDWDNVPMLRLAHALGFATGADPEVFTLDLSVRVPENTSLTAA
jgi:RimJ/RimL family protein N-acetyltransferase